MWCRALLLLACLAGWAYIELTSGTARTQLLGRAAPAPRCAFPPLAEVAAAWAQRGAWYSAPSAAHHALYTWEEAITIHVGNSERYIDGCGAAASREPVLRLRWGFNGTARLPALPQWSRTLACRALLGRGVAVVGDSMSGEFYDALVSALWSGEHGPRPAQRQPVTQVCDGREDGGLPLNASYTYLDHLGSTASEEAGVAEQLGRVGALLQLARAGGARPPPIVVLNRGAHMSGGNVNPAAAAEAAGGEEALHAAINAAHAARLATLWTWLAAHAPDSPVFWRTTSVGHPFCRRTVAAPPLARARDLDAVLREALAAEAEGSTRRTLEDFSDADYKLRWHWDNIPAQNAATLAALPARVHVLDVAPAAALRHDSHPQFKYGHRQRQDCLHYCLPGPIDAWVELFAASVRYGEHGGAEFFSEQARAEMCGGGPGHPSRHTLLGFAG